MCLGELHAGAAVGQRGAALLTRFSLATSGSDVGASLSATEVAAGPLKMRVPVAELAGAGLSAIGIKPEHAQEESRMGMVAGKTSSTRYQSHAACPLGTRAPTAARM